MPVQYYFDELDPTAFQRLINGLLVKRYGEGIRLLPLRGADGGRDAETPVESTYYTITIPGTDPHASRNAIKPGRYLFQVKHHRLADRAANVARSAVIQDFGQELTENVVNRADDQPVDYFFLITNVPSSRDAFTRVDEKRLEARRGNSALHAEVLWQDHVTAWLDHCPSIWTAFPEIFAGRTVPSLGQIAGNPGPGMPLSMRLAISTQMRRDSVIRFRQINLEQRLSRLFVDLNARSSDSRRVYVHMDHSEFEEVSLEEALIPFPGLHVGNTGTIPLLTSEIHRDFSKVILEGGPGQGKSTVTQMLVQIYRSLILTPNSEYSGYWPKVRRARLPIRVELRLFAEWLAGTNRSVEQYLAETFSADAGGAIISVEDLHNAARQQDVLLVFDGLDEVGSDTLRDEVVAKIVDSVARFETVVESDLRVIVTSRPPAVAGRLDALSGFKRLQLQPLDEDKINEYLDRWTEVQCSDAADRQRVVSSFVKRKTEDHVAALAKNPMQLSVLLHFIRLKGEAFPDKRAELYREYFKTVIDRDVEKSPELRRNRDDIETLHEVIGFTIHSRAEGANATSRLTRPDLIRLVRKWFETEGRNPDLGESLFAIGEERLGLIVALSGEGENTQYGFEIQPVREYFAAAFINDKCEANAHDVFEHMMRRPFWREVARFLAGLRRANERADLLSRAKQLDEDPESGWRSDGLTITLQLLQEGVLSTPGNVHRDALGFLIGRLDADDRSVRVQPKGMVNSLPRLIASCDSDQPKSQLNTLLRKSRSWTDHHDLKRLWAVCNRVFPAQHLIEALGSYEGNENVWAEMEIRWPVESGVRILSELDQLNQLAKLPKRAKNENLFFATASDPALRDTVTSRKNHLSLLEEFAFQGIFKFEPFSKANSHLAVWQLWEWLHRSGLSLRHEKVTEDAEGGRVDVEGLPSDLATLLTELIELLRATSLSGSSPRRKATRELLHRLIQVSQEGELAGLIAMRCATTLFGYVEGPRRVVDQEGRSIWAYIRQAGPGRRTEAWQEFRKSLLPYFGAAVPKPKDAAGRTVAAQFAGRGFYRSLQSHIPVHGELVGMLDLLIQYREGQGGPDWLERMPIQQYWLRRHLGRKNVEPTLEAMASNRLDWSSRTIPLTQRQIGWIAESVRNTESGTHGTEVLFALQRSALMGRFREGTLASALSNASNSSSHGTFVFEGDEYSRQGVPEGITNVAEEIISGSVKTTSALAAAAATFMSERRASKQPPLRELGVFPQSARAWFES